MVLTDPSETVIDSLIWTAPWEINGPPSIVSNPCPDVAALGNRAAAPTDEHRARHPGV
jgi:hypothetical protein